MRRIFMWTLLCLCHCYCHYRWMCLLRVFICVGETRGKRDEPAVDRRCWRYRCGCCGDATSC